MKGFVAKPALIKENQRIQLENHDLKERIAALEKENTCLSLVGGAAFVGIWHFRSRYSRNNLNAEQTNS